MCSSLTWKSKSILFLECGSFLCHTWCMMIVSGQKLILKFELDGDQIQVICVGLVLDVVDHNWSTHSHNAPIVIKDPNSCLCGCYKHALRSFKKERRLSKILKGKYRRKLDMIGTSPPIYKRGNSYLAEIFDRI